MPTAILLVDDNPDDREVITRALQSSEMEFGPITEAVNQRACMGHLVSGQPADCVLLDYSLPGDDGIQVLEKIMDLDRDIPVVMITRRGDEEIAVTAMRRGAQDYLSKDAITRQALERSISRAIERAGMSRMIRLQRQSLEAFAHILVHDLRAPLRSIKGGIDMLIEDLPPEIISEHHDLLGFVQEGATRMDQLIMALQGYNSLGGTKPEFCEVDIADQVRAVTDNLAADIRDANAEVRIDGATPKIYGHGPQITQLLQNVVGNGIKYNRQSRPCVTIRVEDGGDAWHLTVSDNGIGIDADQTDRIFEPFKRLHAEGEFDGTGLGLATCKRIMDIHGGAIWCTSQPGEGTSFVCQFPKADSSLSKS